ncbi:hypothetical protein QUF61_17530 [Candidatus Venteria ishoeyi]|uniref:hypothetical protein n=1 Tax=Candidatus Venteria ishoeyi TaxID=1899563 RepID=UPI0025A5FB1B|nr:hypothetical protein [Candidatus Venteria ishoeyi]MDM8548296.1 hypothetical protein [Candidatus Venteria ishoeyi]
MAVEKIRNGGAWTEAEFNSRITSALRKVSSYWKPKQKCLKKANVSRGMYRCEHCKQVVPLKIWGVWKSGKKEGKPRKITNILADHINPVVDPAVGNISWDVYIERMFVEEDGYQALCHDCHSKKTKAENAIATARRKRENS